jgi:hypothetical protein
MAQGGRSIVGVVRLLRRGLWVLLLPAACAGGATERGRKPAVIEARHGATVEATPGDIVDLVVTRPVAVSEEHQFSWAKAPEIEGDAVRFARVRVEPPPPDVDGGETTHHYELEAVSSGRAVVVLERLDPGPLAPTEAAKLEILVRERGAVSR